MALLLTFIEAVGKPSATVNVFPNQLFVNQQLKGILSNPAITLASSVYLVKVVYHLCNVGVFYIAQQ